MLKVRLSPTKKGSKSFRIVVIDSRESVRSGNYIKNIGTYNKLKNTNILAEKASINIDMYNKYIESGAQPTAAVLKLVNAILKHKTQE